MRTYFPFSTAADEEAIKPIPFDLGIFQAILPHEGRLISHLLKQGQYGRAQMVIKLGGEPYCQPVMDLNALSRCAMIGPRSA